MENDGERRNCIQTIQSQVKLHCPNLPQTFLCDVEWGLRGTQKSLWNSKAADLSELKEDHLLFYSVDDNDEIVMCGHSLERLNKLYKLIAFKLE